MSDNGSRIPETSETMVGAVSHLRVSPDRLQIARPVPEQFIRDERMWLSVYFKDGVGLTVELLSEEDVKGWTVLGVDG
jgi:hypothetical protein